MFNFFLIFFPYRTIRIATMKHDKNLAVPLCGAAVSCQLLCASSRVPCVSSSMHMEEMLTFQKFANSHCTYQICSSVALHLGCQNFRAVGQYPEFMSNGALQYLFDLDAFNEPMWYVFLHVGCIPTITSSTCNDQLLLANKGWRGRDRCTLHCILAVPCRDPSV